MSTAGRGRLLGDQLTVVDMLRQISDDVGSQDDVDTIPDNLLRAVVEHSPWTQCCASIYELDTGNLVARFHHGFDPLLAASWGTVLEEGSPTKNALDTGEPITIADVQGSTEYSSWTERYAGGYSSSLYIPVRISDREGAVLSVHHPVVHHFGEMETALGAAIASFAAVAFRNMIARERAVRAERRTNELLLDSNSVVLRQNKALQHQATVHERLLQGQLANRGVHPLCQVLRELMDCPVIILDRFDQPMSAAGTDVREAAGIVEALRDDAVREQLGRLDVRPAVLGVDGHRLLLGRARDGNRRLGCIIAVDPDPAQFDEHLRVLELGSLYVALEVLKRRAALEKHTQAQEAFVAALLDAESSTAEIVRRADALDVDTTGPVQVLCARVTTRGVRLERTDRDELANVVARRLEEDGVRATVAPVADVDLLVVVDSRTVPSQGISAVSDRVRDVVRTAVGALGARDPRSIGVAIGLGKPGVGVDPLRASQAGARRAVDVVGAVGNGDEDLSIVDAGTYTLLATTSLPDRREFVDRYLAPLVTYDRDHGSDLVSTLAVYFGMMGNVQRTAEKMYLHISTVRYRLGRIETLCSVSLRDEEDRLCLQLGLRMLRMADVPDPSS